MSSDRFGGGDSPSARRRARRRRLSGLDAVPERSNAAARPTPRSPEGPPQRAGASEFRVEPTEPPSAPERAGRSWFEWRGWDSVITYVVLAVMLAGVVTGLHRLLAAGILVIGASAFVWAVTHRPGHKRSTGGYGVLLDWLMGVLPRPVYLILCVVVTALGLVGVITG
jgi:hypothetical protein